MDESTQLQQAQLAAVLGADPSQFETLISSLMSSSNETRSQAELIFNLAKQHDPNSLCLKLAHLLQFSPHLDARAMSAVLLRKLLTRDDSYLWPRLSPQTQSSLKSILLACLQQESVKSNTKKLCDTVSELASGILPDNGWPELFPFMFQCVTSDSDKLQESAFLIFAQLSQYIGESLIPFIKELHGVFLQRLGSSTNFDVKIAALNAVINFIQCLDNSSDRDRFQDLLPSMIRTLTEALNNGNEATAQEALELLIELAGTEPRFLRRQLVDVVGSMLQIAEAESLEEGTRHLAIEFVITLAEARERAPGMMRKLPQFISRLFGILMTMLLDIEDDPAWHSAENEDEDAGETSNYSVGQECLDRLAISLGGNTIVPVASEQLPAYLAAPEWQKHHAALIALAQIAEGCSKVMLKTLEQVVTMVLNSFYDPHPRVRWAAINAIGQLSTDLGPDLQNQYHQRVLPALAAAMDDFQNPRVQAHAASAVLNFSENCTPEILTPYLDGVVSKLLVLLQNGKQMVQEGALTALASVADSSQEHFQKYYDAVMPYLKTILVNANDKANRMLRAKSMECISLVGMAVGKEKFRDDAKQVMDVLMSLQVSQMESDDPTTTMPELLRSAKLAVEKGLAQGRNESYVKQLSDYIIPALVEALHKEPDTEICASMLDALNECLQISGVLVDESQVRSVVDEIKLVITASSSRKRERAERAKAEDFDAEEGELIKEENEQEEEVFDQVGEILGTLIKTFKASFLPLFDELSSYLTPMWGKDKTTEERRIAICIFDDVAEQCREAALKYYDTYLPFLLEACNDENPDVRQAAVYGLGVCAEFGGSVFKHLVGEALSRLNVVIRHPNAKQPDNVMAYDNAVSALGKICQFHRDSIDSAQRVKTKGSFYWIIENQCRGFPIGDLHLSLVFLPAFFLIDSCLVWQVVPAWLNCLPITGDLIEAKAVHEQLCLMVERSDRELLGPNNQYLPKIVLVFAEVLCGKDLATDKTLSRMANLLRHLQQTLPPATWASTLSVLHPQQQMALQSILSS
ncbi:hypothetical protein SADUNF_Sadunf03G0166000 [Salix dunnii]|uniref:TOG domain-containing protein n=1 Tax=Salix dunnii TaxID=1413687 RepID=A0A835N5A1_9ROSI|nr:hypothetical protein SADUNF_Sadunf03G0166000 [Salix dunnii]